MLAACRISESSASVLHPVETPNDTVAPLPPTATPEQTRLLSICMGSEPASLFLYGDFSMAARNIRQAIYDGPYDVVGFQVEPVILTKTPTLDNGGVIFESVEVQAEHIFVNGHGDLLKLGEGVDYKPVGCRQADCMIPYSGSEAVQMEQMVVRFELLSGLLWSDGEPLSADDSIYSYEVATSLYPQVRADLVVHTAAYQAIDDATVEWRGVPGYSDPGYATNFFTPLPRHAWGTLSVQDLLTTEISTHKPIGWGPYIIDEWTAGDHIALSRNPNYFRRSDGLPSFDKLVFRFVPDKDQAVSAVMAGECDLLDETLAFVPLDAQLADLETSGRARVMAQASAAWEHADFGIQPAMQPGASEGAVISLFQLRETRQAMAMCIDRQRLVDELFLGKSLVPDSYVPPSHPLFNSQVKRYTYDPGVASALFESAGWLDHDGNPDTPRLAQGVAGVTDGTPLAFTFLTTTEMEKQQAAQIIQASLAQCGVKMEIGTSTWDVLFAPGPEGPVFGRKYDMAQFGWEAALQPPCFLYTSAEIPDAYPQAPKGWGGANVSGYSNAEFDRACQQALTTIPGMPEHQAAHQQAQAIFAEDLPAIPLYARLRIVVSRPDLCGVSTELEADSVLWGLEYFDYGQSCAE